MIRALAAAALALVSACAAAAAAGVIVPAESRYSSYSGELPACDDPGVLDRISARFEQKEGGYWNSPLVVGDFQRIREIGFRANGVAYIPRRYCAANAATGDGRRRTVIYAIEEKLGIIGWGSGVEWCVVGLDRNFAYAPGCSAIRPFVERWVGDKAIRARY